ncbi:guanylate-binding protein 3-like isoform X2 [Mya arenaria]|uniref:guanylate-binding protein 3-like isoform X2 n=1 Tax=Mya arenaria TaxID=6604 RepID=UPI0022E2A82E|nr:guanylate-binding protein 3-like isoform X2 [Mya arenaria]
MAEKEHTTDSAAYGDVKSRKSFFESVFSDKSGKLPTRTLQGKNKTSPQTEKGQSHLAGNQSSTVVAKKDRDQGKEELHDQRKDDKVEVEQRLTKTPENRKTRDWFPHNLEVFKKPMCLISTEGENILKVEEETLKQIEKIDLPCCVVVVAGLYRTGKSYLMNRLAEAHSGFALGDTIESKTKGIWVWCKMHPEKKQTVLILLDTEGLGDVKKGDQKHDNRLFTLAALLSSTLVYNMKGTFDQDAVSKLTFVSEIANNIQFKGRKQADNCGLKLILPTFILVLRDFALKIVIKGRKLSQDEYLEDCLKSDSTRDDEFNEPREAIRTYFPQRKCFTLPAPGDSEVVENLEMLEFGDLCKAFQTRTAEFVSFVYSEDHKKLGFGKPVNGSNAMI